MMKKIVACSVLIGRVASAEPEQIDSAKYRTELAFVDGASLSLFLVAGFGSSDRAGDAALASYALGAPIVHALNGHGHRAFGSLGIHLGLAAAGIVTGGVIGGWQCSSKINCSNNSELDGAWYGLLAGVVAASAIDIAFLPNDDEQIQRPPQHVVQPTFGVSNNAVHVGLGGSF